MPVKSDDPLRRVTLNLYEADCIFLEAYIGRGWTEWVRTEINAETARLRQLKNATKLLSRRRQTLGDLFDDTIL